jgi:D-alanyl-lipoteichoic acid acyltransferase DltB (MBOAT superfamily)
MDTASFQFVLFGLAIALVSNLSRSQVWRSIVLFVASIVFLGLLEHHPIAFLPLAGFLLLGYSGLLLLERGWSRSFVWSILAVIFVYIWLKKYTVLPEGMFIHHPYFILGLSYIFFRVLHLLIETGDGNEKRHIGLGAYLLYTLNFTTLVSGPIQGYDEFARDRASAGAHHPRALQGERAGDAVTCVTARRSCTATTTGSAVAKAFRRFQVDRSLSALSVCEFFRLHRRCDCISAACPGSTAGEL